MDSTLNSSAATKTIECPFAFKWEIEEDKLAALKNSENGYLTTQLFNASNIPGVQYFLTIYPNGNNKERRGKVYTFLQLNLENEKRIKAEYKMCIESADFTYKFNHEFEKSEEYGVWLFTPANLFAPEKKYITNGKLSIKYEGTLKVERKVNDNKWEKSDGYGELWNAKAYSDFTILVDGKSIQAHKCVLGTRSKYFDIMFNSGMKETAKNKMEIIDFTYETVELAIQLMYDRKMSTLKMEEKMDVLRFFDKYCILDFKDLIEASLIEDISLTTVVQIANYSIITNHVKFQERCMNFMVASFRMNQLIDNFNALDKDFAFKVFGNIYYQIVKT